MVNEISGWEVFPRPDSCELSKGTLWKEHFEGLLGQPPEVDDQPVVRVFDALPINTGDFTVTELREAIKSMQGNRATGLDGIPAEVWKLECFSYQLLEVCLLLVRQIDLLDHSAEACCFLFASPPLCTVVGLAIAAGRWVAIEITNSQAVLWWHNYILQGDISVREEGEGVECRLGMLMAEMSTVMLTPWISTVECWAVLWFN